MSPSCGHLLCQIIGDSCSIATGRSRGCTATVADKTTAPEVFEEVRALLAAIDPDRRDARVKTAAVRLAAIIRSEAREDRHLLAQLRDEDPELAPVLARLCLRA